MTDPLHRLAAGSPTTLLSGAASLFNQFRANQREDKAAAQQQAFKQQQLDVSQGRLDLERLTNQQRNTVAQSQLQSQNELRDQQVLTQKTTQKLNDANLTAKDLADTRLRGQVGGRVGRSLLQTFPGDELQQQANYAVAVQQAAELGGQLPPEFPGIEGLKRFVLASDVTTEASNNALQTAMFNEKIRQKKITEQQANQRKSAEALINIKGNLTPNQISAVRTLEPDSADALVKEALSAKGLGDAKAKASEFLNGIIQSNELFVSIDKLENHPGLKQFQGLTAGGLAIVGGTPAADFAAALRQFDAKKFQANLGIMKNLGALTDTEGKRLVDNLTVTDPKLSPGEFLKNLLDAKRQLRIGIISKWTTDNQNIPPKAFAWVFDNPSKANVFEEKFKDQLPNGWYFIKNTLFKEEKQQQVAEKEQRQQQRRQTVAKPIGSTVTLSNGEARKVGFNKRLVTFDQFRQQERENIQQRRIDSGESSQSVIDQLRQNLNEAR